MKPFLPAIQRPSPLLGSAFEPLENLPLPANTSAYYDAYNVDMSQDGYGYSNWIRYWRDFSGNGYDLYNTWGDYYDTFDRRGFRRGTYIHRGDGSGTRDKQAILASTHYRRYRWQHDAAVFWGNNEVNVFTVVEPKELDGWFLAWQGGPKIMLNDWIRIGSSVSDSHTEIRPAPQLETGRPLFIRVQFIPGSPNTYKAWYNGVEVGQVQSSYSIYDSGATGSQLFDTNTFERGRSDFRMGMMLIVDGPVSNDEINKVRRYAHTKWGWSEPWPLF